MKHLALRVTAESALAIRADHTAGGAAKTSYIPGSTLVGGLTMFYRQLYERDAQMMELFAPLFLHEQVLYPNLYPAIFADEGLQGRNQQPVYPMPLTAQSCKRHFGFLFPDIDENDGHGVCDTLIDWGLFKLNSSDQTQALTILQPGKKCRHTDAHGQLCGETMKHEDRYYRIGDIAPFHKIAAQSDSYTRLQTHNGIHRDSGTVQDGILYNRQVFDEGMQFWGEVIFPDDEQLLMPFAAFLAEISAMGLLHLGTGRSRGMGKVSLALEPIEPAQDRFTAFSQRLDAFNDAFRDRAEYFKLDKPEEYFFAVTLHSPLILCDDLLRYRGIIDVHALVEALYDYAIPDLESIYHAASVRRITGWQELWGTPRTAEYAIDSGSVFLFSCSLAPDIALRKALFALEEQGMGKRRAEGFGRVCISDAFHLQVQQEGV
jgi:CRISPR-associated protein Csx10